MMITLPLQWFNIVFVRLRCRLPESLQTGLDHADLIVALRDNVLGVPEFHLRLFFPDRVDNRGRGQRADDSRGYPDYQGPACPILVH